MWKGKLIKQILTLCKTIWYRARTAGLFLCFAHKTQPSLGAKAHSFILIHPPKPPPCNTLNSHSTALAAFSSSSMHLLLVQLPPCARPPLSLCKVLSQHNQPSAILHPLAVIFYTGVVVGFFIIHGHSRTSSQVSLYRIHILWPQRTRIEAIAAKQTNGLYLLQNAASCPVILKCSHYKYF